MWVGKCSCPGIGLTGGINISLRLCSVWSPLPVLAIERAFCFQFFFLCKDIYVWDFDTGCFFSYELAKWAFHRHENQLFIFSLTTECKWKLLLFMLGMHRTPKTNTEYSDNISNEYSVKRTTIDVHLSTCQSEKLKFWCGRITRLSLLTVT